MSQGVVSNSESLKPLKRKQTGKYYGHPNDEDNYLHNIDKDGSETF
mgnify:CR=1 FL=1